MRNETRRSCTRFHRPEGSARLTSAVAFFVALVVSIATPSLCQAQVTGLGSAANYGLLDAGGTVNIGSNATLNFFDTTTSYVGVGLGSNTNVYFSVGSSLDVKGTLTEGSNVQFSGLGGVNATTTVTNAGSTLSSAWTAAQSASTTYSGMTPTISGITSNSISATGAVTVADYHYLTGDSSGNLTISGTAGQIFIINVTGSSNGYAINLSNIKLQGVSANDVVFNVTGTGKIDLGAGTSSTSTVNGTFLENGTGPITLEQNTTLNGAVLTAGTVTSFNNVTLNAAPIAAVSAPELPSVAMAGVACLAILGRAGLRRIRRACAA